MTRTLTLYNREVEFTEVTAIAACEGDGTRERGILIHDKENLNGDGDCVIFFAALPEDEADAMLLIENNFLETDYRTLESVEVLEEEHASIINSPLFKIMMEQISKHAAGVNRARKLRNFMEETESRNMMNALVECLESADLLIGYDMIMDEISSISVYGYSTLLYKQEVYVYELEKDVSSLIKRLNLPQYHDICILDGDKCWKGMVKEFPFNLFEGIKLESFKYNRYKEYLEIICEKEENHAKPAAE